MTFIKDSLNNDTYIQQEEGMLLSRVGATNFFKDNPYDPWEPSKLRQSVIKLNPNDIEFSETPSDKKLKKMGEYTEPEYRQYDTHWPIAIQYRGKIVLLDGHHRVELARRANIKSIEVAVKNVDNLYESHKIVRESINEIKQNVKLSGLGSIGLGKIEVLKAWSSIKKSLPDSVLSLMMPMEDRFKDKSYEDLRKLLKLRGVRFDLMMWFGRESEYNFVIESMVSNWAEQWNFDKVILNIGGRWGKRHTYCSWDDKGKIGMISISGHDTLGNIDGYFIQYKDI